MIFVKTKREEWSRMREDKVAPSAERKKNTNP